MSLLLSNPPAIIIVNSDISNQVKNVLIKQLRIDEVLDGYMFDQIILTDPDWISNIKNIHERRVLILRPLYELQNREYADIVGSISHGLFSVLVNKFGPHGDTYPVRNLHWGQLGIFVKQKGDGCCGANTCCSCGVDVCCTIRQELDELNNRICSSCSCCGGCCSCPLPTYRTLLVPKLPRSPGFNGGV